VHETLFLKTEEKKKKKTTEKIQAQAAKIIHNTMNSNSYSSSPVFVFKANN